VELTCEACGLPTRRALCHYCQRTVDLIRERRCVSCAQPLGSTVAARVEAKCPECLARLVPVSAATRKILAATADARYRARWSYPHPTVEIVDKRLHDRLAGRVPSSAKTERAGLMTDPPGVGSLLTADLRNTGYQSRKPQARPSGRTGTSQVRGSRANDSDIPESLDHPRPALGLGGNAVTADLGAPPMSDRPMADATRLNSHVPPQGGRVSPSLRASASGWRVSR
jgi:hypothetical protein